MEAPEFAASLLQRVRRMRLAQWQNARDELIDEIAKRPDMPAIIDELTDKQSVHEARVRTCIRRAYRKRFGPNANIAHAETTTHQNFGRF